MLHTHIIKQLQWILYVQTKEKYYDMFIQLEEKNRTGLAIVEHIASKFLLWIIHRLHKYNCRNKLHLCRRRMLVFRKEISTWKKK